MRDLMRRWLRYQPPPRQLLRSLVVLVAPLAVLMLLALITGSGDLGVPELGGIVIFWMAGLAWIWVVPLVRHLTGPDRE